MSNIPPDAPKAKVNQLLYAMHDLPEVPSTSMGLPQSELERAENVQVGSAESEEPGHRVFPYTQICTTIIIRFNPTFLP